MKIQGLPLGIFVCFIARVVARTDDCSATKRSRCRYGILEELEAKTRSLSTHELEFHCRSLRENVECLVKQVSQCASPSEELAKESNGDVIWRAWNYMKAVCDTFGGWWQNSCFQGTEAKQCNKFFIGGASSCNEYERFRVCITDVVENKCTEGSASKLLGSFLLEQAGDLVWRCPKEQSSQHTPKSDISNSQSNTGLIAQDSHLHNTFHSAPLTGDAPFVTGCSARANEEMRGCLDRHQYERDQSLGTRDSEDRLRKTCCATWNYRRCVQNAVRTHCYDARDMDPQSALDAIPRDRDYLCRQHWVYTCSGSAINRGGPVAGVLALLWALVAYQKLFL